MNYLTGVPVKIAAGWKPAKRVDVPTCLIGPISREASGSEDLYDFRVERDALAFVRERRERKRKESEERAARLAAKPAKAAEPEPVRVAPTAAAPPQPPPPPAANPAPFAPPATAPAPNPLTAIFTEKVRETGACLRPLLADSQARPVANWKPNDKFRFRSDRHDVVNLKEFEVETGSPFDQMELNTIDEVQELASVLQNAPLSGAENSAAAKAGMPNGLTVHRMADRPSTSHQNAAYFPGFSAGAAPGSYQAPSTASAAYFASVQQPQTNVVWPQAQLPWMGYNYSGGVYPPPEGGTTDPNWKFAPYYYGGEEMRVRYHSAVVDNPPLAPPLAERSFNARSSSVPRQPVTNLNKASSISVPNLYAESSEPAEAEGKVLSEKSPVKLSHQRSVDAPDPRRSLTPPATAVETAKYASSAATARTQVQLADVFSQMPFDVKTRVNHIAEMGFPRARVARCYKLMKGDDKKVVEHLLLVQSLEDSGYAGDLAELVLESIPPELEDHSKGRRASHEKFRTVDSTKLISNAKYRIEVIRQFSDLGFPMERIVAALRTTSWDRDRALDILLT